LNFELDLSVFKKKYSLNNLLLKETFSLENRSPQDTPIQTSYEFKKIRILIKWKVG